MKKFLLILFLAAAGFAAWYFRPAPPEAPAMGGHGRGGNPADMPPVPIVEGKVEKKDLPLFLDGLGNVQGYNTVTVRTRVDGQLDKVAFKEGQDVKKGDLLAQVDPKPFEAVLAQAVAKKAQDEAQLVNARLDLERNNKLLSEKVVPQQKVDTQKALVDQLSGAVKADDAAIESARVQLSYTTITSPIDGRAGLRLVDEGNVVHAGDGSGLVVITQLKPIFVVFTLPEKHLPQIQKELAKGSRLEVVAMGRDNNMQLGEGELSVVDNQIDVTTGTVKLKATFPNDNMQLWPGQFINARLQLTTRKDGIVVPASVVQRGPENTYVFVIKEDQTVEMRTVNVETFEDGQALIKDGLQAGERVVVDGQYRLQPGSRVKTPEAGGKGKGGGKPVIADQHTKSGKPAASEGGKPKQAP